VLIEVVSRPASGSLVTGGAQDIVTTLGGRGFKSRPDDCMPFLKTSEDILAREVASKLQGSPRP
jgi:hypothetical protein